MCTCMCVGPCMYIANVTVGGQLSGVHSLLPYCGVSLLSAPAWLTPEYLAREPPVSSLVSFSHLTVRVLTLQMYAIASGFLYGFS